MTDLFGHTELRALSWKEPFASLMLHGKIETRKWKTDYRGDVLICAAQKPYTEIELGYISGVYQTERILQLLSRNRDFHKNLGKAIAVGELVGCRPMRQEDENKCFVKYREGLWCHIYDNVRAIEPIDFKGKQGWKKLDEDFRKQIKCL